MRQRLHGILVVFVKEIIDNFRDRRALIMGLIYPLMGPVLLAILVAVVGSLLVTSPETSPQVTIKGLDHAPEFRAFVTDSGVTPAPPPFDAREAVRRGVVSGVLVIPESFPDDIAAGEQAEVQIIVDSTRLMSSITASRLLKLVRDYGRQISTRRLQARGVDPQLVEPITISTVNLADQANLTDFFLLMIPPFIIFAIFLGGVYLSIDAIAGERERNTLEALFVNPLPRGAIMTGKYFASCVYTLAGVCVQLLAFWGAFQLVGGETGVQDKITPGVLAMLLVHALPLIAFAVAVQTVIAAGTHSLKEAQTFLGLLPLVPAIPGLVMVFLPVNAHAWMMAIPAFGQTVLFRQVIRDMEISALHVSISVGVTLGLSAVLLWLAARLYNRETIIFGK